MAGYHFDYDPLSRITGFTTDADGASGLTYDNIGQLTDADHAAGQADEDYAYDATGNRTNTGYQTGSNNRLLADGTSSYLYDDEGRRTRKTDLATGEYVESEWDHRGRLAAAVFRNPLGTLQKKITYEYDTDDRRIARHVDSDGDGDVDQSEHFVYAQGEVALVFSGAGSLTNRYLHGPDVDQVFADENAVGDVLWPLADHQHTVRDLAAYDAGTNSTTVANHRTYDSFGNVTAETNAAVDHLFSYTGREWDADAELLNYRARWYDPAAGRFVSEDPLGFAGGDVNLVRYVTNSPWNFTDPTGQNAVSPIVQTVASIIAPNVTNLVKAGTAILHTGAQYAGYSGIGELAGNAIQSWAAGAALNHPQILQPQVVPGRFGGGSLNSTPSSSPAVPVQFISGPGDLSQIPWLSQGQNTISTPQGDGDFRLTPETAQSLQQRFPATANTGGPATIGEAPGFLGFLEESASSIYQRFEREAQLREIDSAVNERGILLSGINGARAGLLRNVGALVAGVVNLPGTVKNGVQQIVGAYEFGKQYSGGSTALHAGLTTSELTGLNGIADWWEYRDIGGRPLSESQAEARGGAGLQQFLGTLELGAGGLRGALRRTGVPQGDCTINQ